MTTEMTRSEIFEKGRASFIPAEDDNPDCIPFYRNWEGAMQVFESIGYVRHMVREEFHTIIHYACCNAVDYETFCVSFKHALPRIPEKPNLRCNYYAEPTEPADPLDHAFKTVFTPQFKKAFPDKRINSKFAKEKWDKVFAKAVGIAHERFLEEHSAWKRNDDEIKRENDARMEEYHAKCALVNNAELLASKL